MFEPHFLVFGQQATRPDADNISAVAEVPGPKREEGGCQLCKRLCVPGTEAEQAVHVVVVVAAPPVYGPAFMEESACSSTVHLARGSCIVEVDGAVGCRAQSQLSLA